MSFNIYLKILLFSLPGKRGWTHIIHCKDKIPKFQNKYSQKRSIGVSVPISTFIRLWAIYIFPRSVCLFCWRKYVDRSWDYINLSQTCGNWGWGPAIPKKGIHKWDFRCSVGEQKSLVFFPFIVPCLGLWAEHRTLDCRTTFRGSDAMHQLSHDSP